MKEIPLTRGKFALVDDEDFDVLNQHKWCAVPGRRKYCAEVFYAQRSINYRNASGKMTARQESMHRVLLPCDGDVDHRDGNTLNNQRSNLRSATRSQNIANSRKRPGTLSQYRGVTKEKRSGIWVSRIRRNGRMESIGRFSDEETAAMAYDDAAREVFGEFARLNFPREGEMPIH